MRNLLIENWDKGLVTRFEDRKIPDNAASNSLNWLTLGDRIELSGGYDVVGTEGAAGEITGLHISEKVDGTKQPFITHGRKIKYYDTTTSDWVEIGTNTLPADADGEDVAITSYTSSAGYQTWISSPNSGYYKIMTANPGSIKDLYDAAENFKGYIVAAGERMLLWNRDQFKTILYGSFKDLQDSSVYTSVSAEAIGSSGSTNYTGTLAAVTGLRTCFNVVFTDGTQTAQDDKNGSFTGDATGTINYTTGAYNITFGTATTGSVTANYQWEDSTEKGLADYTIPTSPRAATEGFFLPQGTGGDILNVVPYKTGATTEYYCLHENNAWIFSMPVNDTGPTNVIFRAKVGMKNWRAAVPTGEGIYYIDVSDQNEPKFKLITLSASNDQVEPIEFSFNVDLAGIDFTDSCAFEWGDYILFTCKEGGSSYINRMYAFHKEFKTFDKLKYFISCMANNAGELWAGSSLTNSVWRLFSGFSANGSIIENYWEGKMSKIGVDQLKKTKRLTIRGKIAPTQTIRVYANVDRQGYVEIGDIEGDASYVSRTAVAVVGSPLVGVLEVGGGGDGVSAYPYTREFRLSQLIGKFDEIKLKFVALSAGYASVDSQEWYDIKTYGQKNLRKFRQTI